MSAVVVVAVVGVVMEVSSVDVVSRTIKGVVSPCFLCSIFEWPFFVVMFEQPPLNLCHNHSNLDKCLFKTD